MSERALAHPLFVRLTHWINAIAVLVMMTSGWAIYNADPILPFRFPDAATLGGGFIGALRWHFAAMWVFAANTFAMLGYGLISGRYARKLKPPSPRALLADVANALRGRLSHADLSHYNSVQRALYAAALIGIAGAFVSGLAIWKPVQFGVLTTWLGDFDNARIWHFLAMSGLAAFVVVHVAMATLVPRSLLAMLRGR
jgi:thiosulfate reductase cytochrome b subunit